MQRLTLGLVVGSVAVGAAVLGGGCGGSGSSTSLGTGGAGMGGAGNSGSMSTASSMMTSSGTGTASTSGSGTASTSSSGTASTSSSSSSSSGALTCMAMPGDKACVTCMKTSCCTDVTACGADSKCVCILNCWEAGGKLDTCKNTCGASTAWQTLFTCAMGMCQGKCP